MLNEVYDSLTESFDSAIKALLRDLAKIRTGRANLAILDGIRVDYYGSPTPLNQAGTLKVADPRLITIQPWEKNMIPVIEKAIAASDLGLNPASDGIIIRIPIPALTGERRRDLSRIVRKTGEHHKVGLRSIRRDMNSMVKDLEKEKMITEDDRHRAFQKIQDRTYDAVKKIEDLVTAKEKEIMDG